MKKWQCSAYPLKIWAILWMLGDHIAWVFLPVAHPLAQGLHLLGRTTAPILCFFVAQGVHHTRNKPGYLARLFGFGLLAQVPFLLCFGYPLARPFAHLNVMFSLFGAALALCVLQAPRLPGIAKMALVLVLYFALQTADWGGLALLWVVWFAHTRTEKTLQMAGFCVISLLGWVLPQLLQSGALAWFQAGVLLAVPLLWCYNGTRGKQTRWVQWGFYLFYPSHLLALWAANAWF